MQDPILVIAAHPDDEVLGCGGTIARTTSAGRPVHIAILGEGLTSRQPTRDATASADLARLSRTADEVGAFLGAASVRHFDFPDNRFDQVPLLDIVKTIEALVTELEPVEIYTQSGGDLNIDHAVTFRATMTATRPMTGKSVRSLRAYEVASSSEWAFGRFEPRFEPSVFIDISKTLDRKIQAMAMYDSENRPFPHPRSAESLTAAARKWGSTVGVAAAEAFHQIWSVE